MLKAALTGRDRLSSTRSPAPPANSSRSTSSTSASTAPRRSSRSAGRCTTPTRPRPRRASAMCLSPSDRASCRGCSGAPDRRPPDFGRGGACSSRCVVTISGARGPLTLEELKSMLAKLGEATGIRCNAYRFRHTFCTWCADAGMHHASICSSSLGHASSDMVAYYYRGKTSEAVLPGRSARAVLGPPYGNNARRTPDADNLRRSIGERFLGGTSPRSSLTSVRSKRARASSRQTRPRPLIRVPLSVCAMTIFDGMRSA